MRTPLVVLTVWVGAIVLVAFTGFSPIMAGAAVAFVTIGALLGFQVGSADDGPAPPNSSGGPGPSI